MSESASAPAPLIDRRRRTIVLWVVLLAFFMDLLDTTIVNVGDPVDPGKSRRQLLGNPVDHRRLRADLRAVPDHRRTARRHLRLSHAVPDRHGGLRHRFGRLGSGADDRGADRRATGARLHRSADGAPNPVHDSGRLSKPRGASGRVGVLRRACGARHRRRSDHRRASHHRQPVGLRLAGDLPRQSAGRRGCLRARPGSICRWRSRRIPCISISSASGSSSSP